MIPNCLYIRTPYLTCDLALLEIGSGFLLILFSQDGVALVVDLGEVKVKMKTNIEMKLLPYCSM